MGKINMGFFYGKKYYSCNRTFSLENGENFIEGTGPSFNYLSGDLCKTNQKTLNTKCMTLFSCCRNYVWFLVVG